VPKQQLLAVRGAERMGRAVGRQAEERSQLAQVIGRVRHGDEAAAGPEHPGQLGEGARRVGDVVEHPRRHRAVELARGEAQLLDVADPRVDAAAARELDHPWRDVHGHHLCTELVMDPRRELARAAPHFQHATRRRLGDRVERHLRRVRAGREAIRRPPPLQAPLARVLRSDDAGVVERHGSTIGCPGIPRVGGLPPSHAFTVAPTSANSPSWMRPPAFRPST
jgi:hypothetical protein